MPLSLSILIVEDNAEDADLLQLRLPGDGSVREAICVPRLAAALARVEAGGIDLVFLDLALPDSCGLDTLRRMRRQAEKVPIIVLTGDSDEETGLQAIREGAQDFLVKGELGTHLLARSIKYAVERRRSENVLKEMNDSLEQRVAERTEELVRANQALRTEIAERQRAEEEQRRIKEQWERTFASVPDLIAILDHRHRVLRVNEAMARRLGLEAQECVGLPCHQLVHGCAIPFEFCPHSKTICDGGTHQQQLHVERFGGDFLVTTTPLLDEEGRSVGSVHIAHDISEHKRAEVALKRMNEELERRVAERTAQLRERDQMLLLQSRQAAMGEMIGNIAHQWRQPLNALGMLIQEIPMVYEFGELDQRYAEQTAERSMAIIRHMSSTIDDFRNFFQPDKEKVSFHVREEVEKTLSLIEAGFQACDIRVEVVGDGNPVVHGYPNEYSQVLLNILLNARDALVERRVYPPAVQIAISERAVAVSDNAGGIPQEIIDKVFEPYFTTKGPQAGTGVGLFMSKNIIEKNMGGSLTVHNTEQGACFLIEVGAVP